jgi:hypothetical protein
MYELKVVSCRVSFTLYPQKVERKKQKKNETRWILKEIRI